MQKLDYNIYINNTSKQFCERGFECILAVALGVGTLFLLFLFPVMGIALSIFASCFLCLGIKKYLIAVACDEYAKIEDIFSKWKICVKAFCLKFSMVLISFLWSIVFIVPGIVSALNYSMASFIMAEDDSVNSLEAMIKSKKMVYGYRFQIFIVYLSYFLVSLIFLCIFGAIGCAIKLSFDINYWIPIVSMSISYLFVLFIFIVPYFELGLTNVYLTIKANSQKNLVSGVKSKKTTKTQNKELWKLFAHFW